MSLSNSKHGSFFVTVMKIPTHNASTWWSLNKKGEYMFIGVERHNWTSIRVLDITHGLKCFDKPPPTQIIVDTLT